MSLSTALTSLQGKSILVFGKDGQLGRAFQELFSDLKIPAIFIGRKECDLTNRQAIDAILNRYQPTIIFNAAAYTAVDKAESESEVAFKVNQAAVAEMASYIANVSKGTLVHFSTDYVFDGKKQAPYTEDDATNPLGVYGKSKLAGEDAIQECFQNSTSEVSKYFILRTSWVYGDGGNFIRTMLKFAAERDQLRVIVDQQGVPTNALWLAKVALELSQSSADSGIYHTVPDGETTWHGLALYVIELARQLGEGIKVPSERIEPIPASDYPLPAPRPKNSRMTNQKLKSALSDMAFEDNFPKWQDQVAEYVTSYVQQSLKS